MIINGKWVDEYNQNNWSYGPGGGQGLFNPGQQQVYWNQGTPSFQKPQTPTFNGQQIGPTQYGAAAPGWLGGGLPQTGVNQMPTYNQLPTYGPKSLPTQGSLLPGDNPINWGSGGQYTTNNPGYGGPQSVSFGGANPTNKIPGVNWPIDQPVPPTIPSGSPNPTPSGGVLPPGTVGQTIDGPDGSNTTTTTQGSQPNYMQSLQQLLSQLNSPSGGGYNNPLMPNPAGGTQQQFGSFNSLPTYGFYG